MLQFYKSCTETICCYIGSNRLRTQFLHSFFLVLWLLAASLARPAIISEDFAADPARHGWRIFGDTSLFHWNATNQNLEASWDSSRTNSFFYLPLGTVLAK